MRIVSVIRQRMFLYTFIIALPLVFAACETPPNDDEVVRVQIGCLAKDREGAVKRCIRRHSRRTRLQLEVSFEIGDSPQKRVTPRIDPGRVLVVVQHPEKILTR